MESNAVNPALGAIEALEANRAILRSLILPRSQGGGDPQVFPRSNLMRFVLDPRRRRLVFGLVTAAWMLVGRRRRSRWLQWRRSWT